MQAKAPKIRASQDYTLCPDATRHVLPEVGVEDEDSTRLDHILKSSLYLPFYVGMDPEGTLELQGLGGALGLFPLAVLVSFGLPTGLGGGQTWYTDITTELGSTNAFLLLYVAMSQMLHPWALGAVAISYPTFCFSLAEMVSASLAVGLGSYYVGEDKRPGTAPSGWHPITWPQAVGIFLYLVGYGLLANSAEAQREEMAAEEALGVLPGRFIRPK